MKHCRSDRRLSIHVYREAINRVETQFALIRFALSTLSKEKIRGFYRTRYEQELSSVQEVFKNIKQQSPDKNFGEVENVICDSLTKKHKRENRKSDTRFKIEFSEDRLNQSELLLLVAHFESFMKDVHRTFLVAAPAKVFSTSDTKVLLREVFDNQSANVFGRFLKELIMKEVKFLDSQRIDKRANYFFEHFGIAFGSKKEIEKLKEIMDVRNKISHEIYAPPPSNIDQIRDQALVGDEMLKDARHLFLEIPKKCIEAGAKNYQSYFVY